MKFLLTLCLVTMAASAISAKNLPRARTNGDDAKLRQSQTAEEPATPMGCQRSSDCSPAGHHCNLGVCTPPPERKCPIDVFCDHPNEECNHYGMCISKATGCMSEFHGCAGSYKRYPTYTCQDWGGCCDVEKKHCLPTTYDWDTDPLAIFREAKCEGSWDEYSCDFFQVSRTNSFQKALQYGCSYDTLTTHYYCWRQATYGSGNWCWGKFNSDFRRCSNDEDCKPEGLDPNENMFC